MKIKVCGVTQKENAEQLSQLPLDMLGLIFYDNSPRFVESAHSNLKLWAKPSEGPKRVGVFVNSTDEYIAAKSKEFGLDMIQLHGTESPEQCKELGGLLQLPIIKAFSIATAEDLKLTKKYENSVDYLLFDTKTTAYGGSGRQFDWQILNHYTGTTPFLLSGGIGPESAAQIKELQHPKLYGIDLNSRFETEPGVKNVELVNQFIKQIL